MIEPVHHSSEIAAAFAAPRKLELPMVLPMRISQLCTLALGPRRVWLEFLILRLRASAAELDFGARGEGGFNAQSITTLPTREVGRFLGLLTQTQLAQVEEKVRLWLGL